MSTYARCRACDEQIPAEAANCPVCLQERSREEIFEALRGHDPRAQVRRGGAIAAAAWIGLAVGVVWGGLRYSRHLEAKRAEADSRLKAAADAERERWDAEKRASDGAYAGPASFDLEPVRAAAPAPDASEDASKARERAVETKQGSDFWKVTGEVYDLISLKPASGARIRFSAKSGERVEVKTDSRGRYTAHLKKEAAAYTLTIRHSGHDGSYVEEETGLPFKAKSRNRRLDDLQTFRQSLLIHAPLSPPPSVDAVKHSLILLPD